MGCIKVYQTSITSLIILHFERFTSGGIEKVTLYSRGQVDFDLKTYAVQNGNENVMPKLS